jgi:thiamine biosynthesis lipoprotein
VVRPAARWSAVRLSGGADGDVRAHTVTMPPGMRLDLGATAKAHAADRAADAIHAALGCGVLVALGGDVAARGEPPAGGWSIRVQDRPQPLPEAPEGPSQTVAVLGGGLATSSTAARRWQVGAAECHHLLDPWTGMPAVTPWRTVSAAASTCLEANIATTAAIVLGERGLGDLQARGLAARLVATDGTVTRLGGWPA